LVACGNQQNRFKLTPSGNSNKLYVVIKKEVGTVKKKITTRKALLLCLNTALEKKAKNLVVLNVKKLSYLADYFLICSGGSDRQVQAISSSIEESMKKAGLRPAGIEGDRIGKWVLMDYYDIVIHVFLEPVREYYDIERLWSEAPRMDVPEDSTEVKALRRGL
jgi:ribosome-associated protein